MNSMVHFANSSGTRQKILTEMQTPRMISIGGDRLNRGTHQVQDRNGIPMVYIALKNLCDLAARLGLRDKIKKHGRQLIEQEDEFTPKVHPGANCFFVSDKCRRGRRVGLLY